MDPNARLESGCPPAAFNGIRHAPRSCAEVPATGGRPPCGMALHPGRGAHTHG